MTIENGQTEYSLRRIPYAYQDYLDALRERNVPHAEWLIQRWQRSEK